MKRLAVVVVLTSAFACIQWPEDETIRARRCNVMPDDVGCAGAVDSGVVDSGVVDSGIVDAGTDAGMEPPLDTGTWSLAWNETGPEEAHFLVGYGAEGTLVGYLADAGWMTVRSLDGNRPTTPASGFPSPRPASAYEREARLAIGRADGTVIVLLHQTSGYNLITQRDAGFVTTAIDLFPEASGLSVAAYGELDGGLGVRSFFATASTSGDQAVNVPCVTSVMRPQRILPVPDAGPGVVVGNVVGDCGAPFSFTGAVGGFVGFFGGGSNGGFAFPAQVDSPMVLGVINDQMTLAYRPVAGQVALSSVPTLAAPAPPRPILRGTLSPVDLVQLGSGGFAVVGFGSGTVSLFDGGSPHVADGQDIFIARLDSNWNVTELAVFGGQGDQTAVGAVMIQGRLVVGGRCGTNRGLCLGAPDGGNWLAGFSP